MTAQIATVENVPAQGLVTQIERIACNPEADINKLEKLWEMQNESIDRQAEREYMTAMALCQGEMPAIVKDADNTHTRSRFARLETIIKSTKPVYSKHGFSLSFGTAESKYQDHVKVTCNVMHAGGHSKTEDIDLPLDLAGAQGKVNKTKIHATASTYSYGQRYLFCKVFNIAIVDQDDDANAAGYSEIEKLVFERDRLVAMGTAIRENLDSIQCIKDSMQAGDLSTTAEAWRELTEEAKHALWVAPTKGGIFTTAERKALKEDLPRP